MANERQAVVVTVEIPRYIKADNMEDALKIAEKRVEDALDAAFLSPRSIKAKPL